LNGEKEEQMNYLNTEGLLLLVEGTIFFSLTITLLFMRRTLNQVYAKRVKHFSSGKNHYPLDMDKFNAMLKESASLSQDLSKNLEEKKEIVKKLLATLDEKILSFHQLLEKAGQGEKRSTSDLPATVGTDPVLEMALAGYGVSDIAKRLRLSKEEIQLILDLKKITTN
jgi:hypothetical protein